MPLVVTLLLAGKAAVYCGFFFLLARLLDIGTPVDALRAGLYRLCLGAAATIATLVIFIFLRFGSVEPETNHRVGTAAIWLFRAAIWTFAATHVYRVTRWRKGKLAVLVLAGLALDAAIDFGLYRLQGAGVGAVPSFGSWVFRIC